MSHPNSLLTSPPQRCALSLPAPWRRSHWLPWGYRPWMAWMACCALSLLISPPLVGFGRVIPLSGHAADVALDEARNRLYVANYTASRIDIIDTATLQRQSAILVGPQPASLSVSPDGRYLVVAHYVNWKDASPAASLTLINLQTGSRQVLATPSPALAVQFGSDNLALVVTARQFLLLNPASGALQVIATIEAVGATFPVKPPKEPVQITQAAIGSSANRLFLAGVVGLKFQDEFSDDSNMVFRYDVTHKSIRFLGLTATPPLGPRVVSVNGNGSAYMVGWGLFSSGVFNSYDALLAQFPNPSGKYEAGTHVFDPSRGLIYAQFTAKKEQASSTGQSGSAPQTSDKPELLVAADDNLTVLERLPLPESLTGKSVLTPRGDWMFAVSQSGVMALPVGQLSQLPRLAVSQEDLLFTADFCNRQVLTKEIEIVDPGGGRTPFALAPTSQGISVEPSFGTTPARVKVRVDPNFFTNQQGTTVARISVSSSAAVNTVPDIRVLINNKNPDQRGAIFNVPGKLVDIQADPARNRFYILRQDRNEVLVFDGATYSLLARLRTGNTPTQMAVSFDRRYLLVGHENSGIASVFDLDTLQPERPVIFPIGHYPRSIAASGRAILAACRVAGEIQTIDRVDLLSRTALPLASLGVFENSVDKNTVLTASPSGNFIFGAGADGKVLLYDATVDSFVILRKDFDKLEGGIGALSDEFFGVGPYLLNASLVPVADFAGQGGAGYAAAAPYGLRAVALNPSEPGLLTRLSLSDGTMVAPARLAEAPVLGEPGFVFRRTLAPLSTGQAIVVLTTSGFTVVPWNYDAAVADPRIDAVVSAANFQSRIAPGSIVSLFGANLSPVTEANAQVPVPTTLGGSCLTINGMPVPLFFVSSTQVNAQLPYWVSGNATLVLRTPQGASNPFIANIQANAPAVFMSGAAGPLTGLPTIVRAKNNQLVTLSNPVHIGDHLVIYLTGLGAATGNLKEGQPAPSSPPATAVTPPVVTLGGYGLQVTFAGPTPGLVGVDQINVYVPFGVPSGMSVPLEITQGGAKLNLPLRVVN